MELRPTSGLIDLTGAYPRSHTLDAAGPLARTVADASTLLEALVEGKSNGGPAVRSDLEGGARVSRRRYEEVLARKSGQIAEVREVFERVNALLTPTQPMAAPPLDAEDAIFGRIRQFLLPTSFIGLPSVTVPCGFVSEGLPVGLQIVGDHFREAVILRVAAAFESATDFHRRQPPIYRDRLPSSETGGAI